MKSKCMALMASVLALAVSAAERPNPRVVTESEMKAIYEEVKTPYKYGMVLLPEKGEKIDNPFVFRHRGEWYMVFVRFDGKGYETWLAKSDDMLNWKRLGRIFERGQPGQWDSNQAAGYPVLFDTRWGGSNELRSFNGKYWLMYIGGAGVGYEPDPLAAGVAWTDDPTAVKNWQRSAFNPVLHPHDPDARAFEQTTIYHHCAIEDETRSLGHRFVDFYNGKMVFHTQKGANVNQERMGIAVSDDMEHWTRFGSGAVIADVKSGQGGISGDGVVQKIGDLWVMFYFGHGWRRDFGGAWDTFACSRDLEHWTKWTGEPLIKPSEPWDATFAHKPWVIKHNGIVYHFYCAVGNRGRGIGLATSKPLK